MTEIPIYCAPMQGYTDAVWRQAHHQVFGSVQRYFTPFLRVEHGSLRRRDLRDVDPLRNLGIPTTPQILASPAREAVVMARELKALGYRHIDINFGCPFPPLANKRKGCGMMPYPDQAEEMLLALAQDVTEVSFSVKMRLGWKCSDEWTRILPLLDIINPQHITVHPRVGIQQYKGPLNMDAFSELFEQSLHPIVYNGDILQEADIVHITQQFPGLHAVMIGRGLVACPHMLSPHLPATTTLLQFHQMLVDAYGALLTGGEHQLLMRMKALWLLFLPHSDARARKKIKKASDMKQYMLHAAEAIQSACDQ